ncbi:MAG: DUF4153 domain-containing protein [Oscillospiraceae bacterium]|jgi:hypothetical protein
MDGTGNNGYQQGYSVPAYTVPAEKPVYRMEKSDNTAAVLISAACIIGIPASLWGGMSLGFTVTYAVMFAVFTLYLMRKRRFFPIGIYAYISGVLSLGCALVFSISGNSGVNFSAFILVVLLGGQWLGYLGGWRDGSSDLGPLSSALDSLFGNTFRNLGTAMRSVFSKREGKAGKLSKVLLGIACSVIPLIIIVQLLVSADAAFEGFVDNVFGDPVTLLIKVLVGLAAVPFFLSYALGLQKTCQRVSPEKSGNRGMDPTAVNSFLTMISVCYLFYLFSQTAYFFSAFRGMLPAGEDLTPAAYARRGFFEMCAIAGINLLIVLLTSGLSKKAEGRLNGFTKALDTFISIFTLVIIATALSKMVLYMDRFGLTQKRIQTSAFMIFLGVVFLALIVRLYVRKVPVFKISAAAAAVIIMAMGFSNIDARIAEYNTDAYLSGKLETVDVYSISSMGLEGAQSLIDIIHSGSPEADEARDELFNIVCGYYDIDNSGDKTVFTRSMKEFGYWRLSDEIGYEAIENYLEEDDFRDMYMDMINTVTYYHPGS